MGEEQPGTHNRFDGEAATVFQAGDVYGGVHYHEPERRIDPPRQVLPPPEHYTNNEPQLAALSRILTHRDDDDGPKVAIIRGASKRVAMVIDDAVVPSQVRELLPGQGRSVAVVTEAGRLTGLQAKVSARYVTVDPLSPESAT